MWSDFTGRQHSLLCRRCPVHVCVCLSVCLSHLTLELNWISLCAVIKRLAGFLMTLKWVTLNDREVPFMLKCAFCAGFTKLFASLSQATMWKRMKILSYCQRQKCLVKTLVFANIWPTRIFAVGLSRAEKFREFAPLSPKVIQYNTIFFYYNRRQTAAKVT